MITNASGKAPFVCQEGVGYEEGGKCPNCMLPSVRPQDLFFLIGPFPSYAK